MLCQYTVVMFSALCFIAQIHEAALIMHKLNMIAQELPHERYTTSPLAVCFAQLYPLFCVGTSSISYWFDIASCPTKSLHYNGDLSVQYCCWCSLCCSLYFFSPELSEIT